MSLRALVIDFLLERVSKRQGIMASKPAQSDACVFTLHHVSNSYQILTH